MLYSLIYGKIIYISVHCNICNSNNNKFVFAHMNFNTNEVCKLIKNKFWKCVLHISSQYFFSHLPFKPNILGNTSHFIPCTADSIWHSDFSLFFDSTVSSSSQALYLSSVDNINCYIERQINLVKMNRRIQYLD